MPSPVGKGRELAFVRQFPGASGPFLHHAPVVGEHDYAMFVEEGVCDGLWPRVRLHFGPIRSGGTLATWQIGVAHKATRIVVLVVGHDRIARSARLLADEYGGASICTVRCRNCDSENPKSVSC